MDSAGSDKSPRRTALVGREFGRYGIQTAAPSKTRFADIGEIKEVAMYTPSGADAKVKIAMKQVVRNLLVSCQDCQLSKPL